MSARTTPPWHVERFELSVTGLNLCAVIKTNTSYRGSTFLSQTEIFIHGTKHVAALICEKPNDNNFNCEMKMLYENLQLNIHQFLGGWINFAKHMLPKQMHHRAPFSHLHTTENKSHTLCCERSGSVCCVAPCYVHVNQIRTLEAIFRRET